MAESKAQNISSQLWAIANDLRGTMDASSFKDYILSFLFYKYLSIHQEEYLVNNDLVLPPCTRGNVLVTVYIIVLILTF